MNTLLLDGIKKIARSGVKDFAAGIDPSGTKTFQYGIRDAGKSDTEARRRKALGITGGLLAGALLMPSLSLGLLKGIGGFRQGLKGAGKGFLSGFKKPYVDIYQGINARRGLSNAMNNKFVSDRQAKSILGILNGSRSKFSPMHNKKSIEQLRSLYAQGKVINSKVLTGSGSAVTGLGNARSYTQQGVNIAQNPVARAAARASGIDISRAQELNKTVNNAYGQAGKLHAGSKTVSGITNRADQIIKMNELNRVRAIMAEARVRSPELLRASNDYATRSLGLGIGMMGLGGAVNAGSAMAQYDAARNYGKNLSAEERSRMLRSR